MHMHELPSTNGKARTIKRFFSRETSISQIILADQTIIWTLLTNAADFPRWNSTVVSLEGTIEEGQRIQLRSTLDPKRTFKLKVKEVLPEQRLVWGDAMGERTYLLEQIDEQQLRFTMSEKIGGPLFPLFARMIPDFDESFEQFTADLKKEAEIIQQSN